LYIHTATATATATYRHKPGIEHVVNVDFDCGLCPTPPPRRTVSFNHALPQNLFRAVYKPGGVEERLKLLPHRLIPQEEIVTCIY
jgi:hypothetical protein